MNTVKTYIWIVLGLVIMCGGAFLVWRELGMSTPVRESVIPDSATACTLDAHKCPDGTWVGRSGSQCQFVCPIDTSMKGSTTNPLSNTVLLLETRIGATSTAADITIAPNALQDSRCPVDVKCVQAGTVRVRTTLGVGTSTHAQEFVLGKPSVQAGVIITLVSVSPEKESKKMTPGRDYRFVFKIEQKQ